MTVIHIKRRWCDECVRWVLIRNLADWSKHVDSPRHRANWKRKVGLR